MYFCSRECQVLIWQQHKADCHLVKEGRDGRKAMGIKKKDIQHPDLSAFSYSSKCAVDFRADDEFDSFLSNNFVPAEDALYSKYGIARPSGTVVGRTLVEGKYMRVNIGGVSNDDVWWNSMGSCSIDFMLDYLELCDSGNIQNGSRRLLEKLYLNRRYNIAYSLAVKMLSGDRPRLATFHRGMMSRRIGDSSRR